MRHLCGTLTWVIIPKKNADLCRTTDKQAFASLMMDYNNPDKSQQTRPILGLTMMTLKPTNDPTTYTARVYNPRTAAPTISRCSSSTTARRCALAAPASARCAR